MKKFIHDFWQLLKPYWTTKERWSALAMLITISVLTIVLVHVNVSLNSLVKDFYDAISNFNKKYLIKDMLYFVGLMLVVMIASGSVFYFEGLLSARWRRWLTETYLDKWFASHTYYRMGLALQKIDNPDQRISEDLSQFPDNTLSIFFLLLKTALNISAFSILLWQLSGTFSLPISTWNIQIHGYLFWSALLYGMLGVFITSLIGKKLSIYDYQQQLHNANFRFALIRIREASEQIALLHGEQPETNRLIRLFHYIFINSINIIALRMRLISFYNLHNNINLLLGAFLAIPLYLSKQIQLGGLMQISGAFSVLVYSFILLIENYPLFASWRAVVTRLAEFDRAMQATTQLPIKININQHEHPHLTVDNLSVNLPNGESLVEKINLTISPSSRILLTGKSGSGKSTLLRTLAGIWPYATGNILFPKAKKALFLPQKPYLPIGTLEEALTYAMASKPNKAGLLALLELCGLKHLQPLLYEVKHWAQTLSLGEQQLLAFIRALATQPDILFLDESTSALDEVMQARVYSYLHESLPNTAIVSIGHRQSLHAFHNHIVAITNKTLHSNAVLRVMA